jgi:hypothetical protein
VKIEHRSGGNIGGEGRRIASPQRDPEAHAALEFGYVTTTTEAMTYGTRRRHSKTRFREWIPDGRSSRWQDGPGQADGEDVIPVEYGDYECPIADKPIPLCSRFRSSLENA